MNLINLNGQVDHKDNVGHDHADDLNRVFHSESIPDEDEDVEEPEDEESEKGRDGEVLGLKLCIIPVRTKTCLKFSKDVAVVVSLVRAI